MNTTEPIPTRVWYDVRGNATFTLTEDWHVRQPWGMLTIPRGFMCDGPSIPRSRCVRALAALFRLTTIRALGPAILHDYLYRRPCDYNHKDIDNLGYDRQRADKAFRDLLRVYGVGPVGRWGGWALVRLFGAPHWQKTG